MLPKLSPRACATPSRLVLCTALALALSACGGGGGSPGTVPGGGGTQTGVDAARPNSIQFVSSSLVGSSIVLKGSGGLGRQEAAVLTFRVLDQNNKPMSGVTVDFKPSTSVGGLTVTPASGISDATGAVTTTITSGTIPTPVKVYAEVSRNGATITGLSDTLTVSTGLPIERGMSLSASSYNIEGWSIDGATTDINIRLADQFGNPISDDTAVSFIAEGGAIGTSARGACVTSNGACSVKLSSQRLGDKDHPHNGRVTILAYVQGVHNFTDLNGDGQYSCTKFVGPDKVTVPAVYRPLVDTCLSGGEPFERKGDPFLDTGYLGSLFAPERSSIYGGLDDHYDASSGDIPIPFKDNAYSEKGEDKWGLHFLYRTTEIVFSGSTAYLTRQVCTASGCADSTETPAAQSEVITNCSPTPVGLRLYDLHNNPLPTKTTISVTDLKNVTASGVAPAILSSTTAVGGTFHSFTIIPDAKCTPGSFVIKIATPGANGVESTVSSYTMTTK